MLLAPSVEIVFDSRLLVGLDAGAFDDPVERGFFVDDVFLRLERDASDRDVIVVDDRRLILRVVAGFSRDFAVFHLRHAEGAALKAKRHRSF